MKTTKNDKAKVLVIIHLRHFFYLSIFFKKQSRTYSLFLQMLCSLILTMLWLIFLELEIYTDRNN